MDLVRLHALLARWALRSQSLSLVCTAYYAAERVYGSYRQGNSQHRTDKALQTRRRAASKQVRGQGHNAVSNKMMAFGYKPQPYLC